MLANRVQAESVDWWCDPHHRRLTVHQSRTPINEVLDALCATGADTP
jgi:hypothetical protein